MVDLQALQAKYPTFKVVSQPLTDCVCKGTGERTRPGRRTTICICVCLSGTEELRRDAVKTFAKVGLTL